MNDVKFQKLITIYTKVIIELNDISLNHEEFYKLKLMLADLLIMNK